MIKVLSIFGTRPEAIKMAPLIKELESREEIESIVCVTAQHREMLDQVLKTFKIKPDYDLNIMKQGQTLGDVTIRALTGLEKVINECKPDIVLVHGDTTTTFAGALAAFYNQVAIGHVEAGLRTNDKYSPYPEEMNRQMVDCMTDMFFAPTNLSKENLLNGRLFTRVKSKELIHSLLNEISNLHSTLIVFMNQRTAMKMESENYLKNLSTSYNFESIDVKDNSLIEERLKELRNIFNIINPEELKRLESMNLNPKLLIATIEQKLEIYVYTHSETLESLKKKVREISYEVNQKVAYDFEEENAPRFVDAKKDIKKRKNQFLSQLQELEILYKVFSKYGRNLVKKDDLRELYEVKFKILTSDILDVDKVDILSNATFIELECYQEIIFKKIEDILKGKNQNVNFFIPGGTVNCDKSLTDIIGYISKTLKDGENEFSPYKILQDKKLLSLLLAFDEEDGLADFFEKNYVSLDKYSKIVNFYNEYFSWWNVPLSTIYRLMRLNIVVGKKVPYKKVPYLIKYINEYEPLYYLFILYDEYVNISLEYKLPEGLTRVRFHSFPANEEEVAITDYIRKRARKKTIIMPSSLQSVEGALFDKTYSNSIILNDGLERLGINFLITGSLVHVEFPYTLQIFPSAINLAKLKTITIRINQRSIFFEELIDNYLLAQCFKLEETNEIVDIEGNKRDVKEYKIGYIVSRICKLVPTFDELIFINENEKKIIYTKEMLELVTKRKWKIGLPIGWEDPTYLRLTQEEEKLIADKFREIYYDITGQKCIAESETSTLKQGCLKKQISNYKRRSKL